MIRSHSLEDPHRIRFTNGSSESVADLPREKGGDGDGFGPHDLLEAALATCMAMTVRMAARKHDIPLSGVTCEVRIDRSVPGEVTLSHELTFEGTISDDQAQQLRESAERCPVARTLTGAINLRRM